MRRLKILVPVALATTVALLMFNHRGATPTERVVSEVKEESRALNPENVRSAAAGAEAPAPAPGITRAEGKEKATHAHPGFEDLTYATQWATEQKPDFAAFNQWTERYLAAGDKAPLIPEGVVLAERRLVVMEALVVADPRGAIASTVPATVLAQLPSEVTAKLEKRIAGEGDHTLLGVARMPGQPVAKAYLHKAKIDGITYAAHTYGEGNSRPTAKNVPLHGVSVGRELALHENPIRVLERGETPNLRKAMVAACPVSGLKTPVAAREPANLVEPTVAELGNRTLRVCRVPHLRQLAAANEAGAGLGNTAFNLGEKKMLMILIDFPDIPGVPISRDDKQPMTVEKLQNVMDGEVATFMKATSYGKTTLKSTVFNTVLRMPKDSSAYLGNSGADDMYTDVRALLAKTTTRLEDFNLYGLVFPELKLGWLGLGAVNGPECWYNGSIKGWLIDHEVGHNFGMPHANRWVVTNPGDGTYDPTASTGKSEEYGDIYDLVGDGLDDTSHFNPEYKYRARWINDVDTEILSAAGTGTYTIVNFDKEEALGGGNKVALRIKRDDAIDYWVGYRRLLSPLPDRARPRMRDSAYVIRSSGFAKNDATSLIDVLNLDNKQLSGAGLPLGKTLVDTSGTQNIFITPTAQGGTAPVETLTLVVTLGDPAGNTAPTASITPPTGPIQVGTAVSFKANGADPQNDPLAYFWDFGDNTVNVNSDTREVTFKTAGQIKVTCLVSDMKSFPVSAEVTVEVTNPAADLTERTTETPAEAPSNARIRSASPAFAPPASEERSLRGIVNLGNLIVAVGEEAILTSTDGINWETQDAGLNENVELRGITAGAGKFVAVGLDWDFTQTPPRQISYVSSSTDGEVWTSQIVPKQGALNDVTFASSLFVAIGEEGTILTSSDGVSWTNRTSNTAADLARITSGGGAFVAVGDSIILRSVDGISWSSASTLPVDFVSVAFANGIFVATPYGGTDFYTSPTGAAWTKRAFTDPYFVTGIATANDSFFAVGRRKNVDRSFTAVSLTSTDGLNWTEHELDSTQELTNVIGVGSSFFLVGEHGTIYQSGTIGVTTTPVLTGVTSATGRQGDPFQYRITASGNPSAFNAVNLPAGLSINQVTGKISGTPTDLGATPVTISAINAAGTVSDTLTITIVPSKPGFTSAESASGIKDSEFGGYQIVTTPAAVSYGAVGLPTGLTIDTDGYISGTPTIAGKFTVQLSATNAGGTSELTLALEITGTSEPEITSPQSAVATLNAPFSYQIEAIGATSYGATGAPQGLSVDSLGELSGTPTVAGTFTVRLSAGNGIDTGYFDLTLTVAAGDVAAGADSPLSFISGGAATPFSQTAVTNDGGLDAIQMGAVDVSESSYFETTITGPGVLRFAWSVSSEEDSDVLRVEVDSLIKESISGEVDWEDVELKVLAGIHTVRWAYVKDASGSGGADTGWVDGINFTPDPLAPDITSADEISGVLGEAVNYQVEATNSPTSYSAEGLPPGLTFSAGGLLAGIPTVSGDFLVDLSATNAQGTGTLTVMVTIDRPQPVVTSTLEAQASQLHQFNYQVTASNEPLRYAATGLPDGLAINTRTGLISGFPIVSGTYDVEISALNYSGEGTATLEIEVVAFDPEITSADTIDAPLGLPFSYKIKVHGSINSFDAEGLPPGLSVNASTGLISGTPTQIGVYEVELSATDNEYGTGYLTLTIEVFRAGAKNDLFARRTELLGTTFVGAGTSTEATSESGEPAHAGNIATKSLWWTWTADETRRMVISTQGSNFDTVLAVYEGDSLSTLGAVANSDIAGAVTFDAIAGHTYQIAVDGFEGASGEIFLSGQSAGSSSFNGLITNEDKPQLNGFIKLSLSATSRFSGSLKYNGRTLALRGTLDEEGKYSGNIQLGGTNQLFVTLELDRTSGSDALTGTITENADLSMIRAEKIGYDARNPAPQAGRYTMQFERPGIDGDPTIPEGHGYGTAIVSRLGFVTFKGVLGDGSIVKQSARLSSGGEWPMFLTTNRGKGSVCGWITFSEAPVVLTGNMTWFKAATTSTSRYPNAFVVENQTLFGASYTPPPRGSRLLTFVNGTLAIGEGGLGTLSRSVTIDQSNRATLIGGVLQINAATGNFSGSFLDDGGTARKFGGVLIQGTGFGFFLGGSTNGYVELAP